MGFDAGVLQAACSLQTLPHNPLPQFVGWVRRSRNPTGHQDLDTCWVTRVPR